MALAVGIGLLLRQPAAQPATAPSGVPATATTRQLPPEQQPGPATVRLAEDAAGHPDAGVVRALLQGHFDAINLGDYRRWTTTVVLERAEATTEETWREQYGTTTDGSILVHRLAPRPAGGLTVLLSFTSVQDPADAPEDTPYRCLRWRVSYPVVTESDQLRLGPGDPESSRASRCS
ncbi:MAG: hypothetical protein GEV09_15435 [Pseudonocardiaceae bacterium]|nr:hypothetical protein [Pseudonocardiaceae bacterium]